MRKAIDYMEFAWASYHTRKLAICGINDFGFRPWVEPDTWIE